MFKFNIVAAAPAWIVGMTLLASCQPHAKSNDHPGSTGVCFSLLATLKDGAVVSRHQVIVVRTSGDLSKDITRTNGWYEAAQIPLRNPHTYPNVWFSAWLDDETFDTDSGPDCSKLPMIKR